MSDIALEIDLVKRYLECFYSSAAPYLAKSEWGKISELEEDFARKIVMFLRRHKWKPIKNALSK